jgi:hypothetical protein
MRLNAENRLMLSSELTAEQAIKLHREFLQGILADVMRILNQGSASDERLITALDAYWEACLARREQRRAVLAATKGTQFEHAVEPMGKPFLMMVRAELMPRRGAQADQVALQVYDEARAIAVAEALSGTRDQARREKLASLIRD